MGKINLSKFDKLVEAAENDLANAEIHTLDWNIKNTYVELLSKIDKLIDRKPEPTPDTKAVKPEKKEAKDKIAKKDTEVKEIEKTDKEVK